MTTPPANPAALLPTPRTEKQPTHTNEFYGMNRETVVYVPRDFARQLERELIAATTVPLGGMCDYDEGGTSPPPLPVDVAETVEALKELLEHLKGDWGHDHFFKRITDAIGLIERQQARIAELESVIHGMQLIADGATGRIADLEAALNEGRKKYYARNARIAELERELYYRKLDSELVQRLKVALNQPGIGSCVDWAKECRTAVDKVAELEAEVARLKLAESYELAKAGDLITEVSAWKTAACAFERELAQSTLRSPGASAELVEALKPFTCLELTREAHLPDTERVTCFIQLGDIRRAITALKQRTTE